MIRKILIKLLGMKWARLIPDRLYLQLKFFLKMGMRLQIKHPETFNQKIQWLKLYEKKEYYVNYVDKVLVRDIIAQRFSSDILVPIVGIYTTFDEINFHELPLKFVLKPSHLSGKIFVCKNKQSINYEELRQEVNLWMKSNYFWSYRELPYKFIKPRLIIEELLEDEEDKEFKDYKVMCFDGKVWCSFVTHNRSSKSNMYVDFYNRNWERLPFIRRYKSSNIFIEKPYNYEEMIRISEELGKEEKFLRVDFYEVNRKLYFGEITLYPGAGFESFNPLEWDYKLGSYIDLSKSTNKN